MRPHSNYVRVVDWQWEQLVNYVYSIVAAVTAIAAALAFLLKPQVPVVGRDSYMHKIDGVSREYFKLDKIASLMDDNQLSLDLIYRRLGNISELIASPDGTNRIIAKLDEILVAINTGGTGHIAELIEITNSELEDLNCAVHKCEIFNDEPDLVSIALLLSEFDLYQNLSGVIGDLEEILISDNKCLHPIGYAQLSHNIYYSCNPPNFFTLTDTKHCDDVNCYTYDGISDQSYCFDDSSSYAWHYLGEDHNLVKPAYYAQSIPVRHDLSDDPTFKNALYYIEGGHNEWVDEHSLSYLHIADGVCRFHKSNGDYLDYDCASDEEYYLYPMPQSLRMTNFESDYCFNIYSLDEQQCTSKWDTDLFSYDFMSIFLFNHGIVNVSLDIQDQDYQVNAVYTNVGSMSDATGFQSSTRLTYVNKEYKVNISFPITTDYSFKIDPICVS